MLVSDYIDDAAGSVVASLTVADVGVGSDSPTEVQTKNRTTMLGYLNQAIVEIYRKFVLANNEIVITNPENNKRFNVPKDFMFPISASLEDGTEIGINNDRIITYEGKNIILSVMFPNPLQLEIRKPDDLTDFKVSIIYAQLPKKLTKYNDIVALRPIYTEAVLMYIAYKAFGSMKPDMESGNNIYYMRFNAACKDIRINGGIDTDNLDNNYKLEERGFV